MKRIIVNSVLWNRPILSFLRAKRPFFSYIYGESKTTFYSGYIWHITHRCHKREFLPNFSKDRHRCMWVVVTVQAAVWINNPEPHDYLKSHSSAHCRWRKRDVIPKSMKLVARRTGQEYNQRKNRSGDYWKDRYHARAVENGEHLVRCLVYIDMNTVRAGGVSYPLKCSFSGYNEIRRARCHRRRWRVSVAGHPRFL